MKNWSQWKYPQNFLLLILTPTRSCRETWCKIMNINSNSFLKTRNCPNCAPTPVRRLLSKDNSSYYTWWRRRTIWNEESMSRVHVSSKRRSIPSERVDSRKHEHRPCLGCEGLPSSKTLRYRNHDRTLFFEKCKWNTFSNQKWIDPRRKKSQKRQANRVFHCSEPDGRRSKHGRNLDKPKIAPYKNTWRPHQNTMCWCNLKLAQKKGLQFYQTRSHAIVLYNTLPAFCFETAVRMKTKEELYNKVYQSPRLPRVTYWSRTRKVDNRINMNKTQKILWPPKRIGK